MPHGEPIPRSLRLGHIQAQLYAHPGGLSCSALARACGVTVRTIERDLLDLQGAPQRVPLLTEGRRWKLMEGYRPPLDALRLMLPEATALFLAARLLLRASDENNPYVTSALAKLATVLPPAMAEHVRIMLLPPPARAADDAFVRVFAALTDAWAMQRKVRLWHRAAASDNVHEYLFSPYFIEPSAPSYATYVIGYEELFFKAVRTFKLERVQRAVLMEAPFTIPADFDIAAFLGSAWGIMGGGATVEVALRFAPEATRRVKESVWHPAQTLEDMADGGCVLRVPVSQPIEMIPWIRGWAHNVEVLAPAALRARVAEEAGRTVERYGGGGGDAK